MATGDAWASIVIALNGAMKQPVLTQHLAILKKIAQAHNVESGK